MDQMEIYVAERFITKQSLTNRILSELPNATHIVSQSLHLSFQDNYYPKFYDNEFLAFSITNYLAI